MNIHLRTQAQHPINNRPSQEGGVIEITICPLFTPSHTIMPPTKRELQQMVEIAVRDQGIGIPQPTLDAFLTASIA